jgi:hypothetical protein
MTRRRVLLVVGAAAAATLLLVPLAGAASDLYSNVGPGGSVSGLVDRYPLGSYALDSHFSAVKASLTGGIDASGIPAMIAFFLANLLWQITAFAANAVIALFALAFSVDLLNGSPQTAGAGALAPVADAIHNLYANTLGEPWMVLAIVVTGCWAMWRALVQRRYAETASALGMSLVFCLLALAIVTRPDATIGQASRLSNEVSSAFLSVTAHGDVTTGSTARRAASDQLFDLLVFRPWVALEFGGTEHCIRTGTGSKDHDPQSVSVRPLAADPAADAKARAQLQRTGQLSTPAKQCVDNTVRYPAHFLMFPPGSDDRDSEFDAINNADPSKLPDSDPTKNTYKPAIVDKPVSDAMEAGGQYQRLLLAIVILVGELGALLLLGALCVSVLLAQIVVLLLACFSPVALVAAIIPGRGHDLFRTWATHLVMYLARKAVYSLVLAIVLAVLAALQDASTNLGWLLSFALQAMLLWMVFLQRDKLAGHITAALAGQHPGRDTQLRRLLGVAYATSLVNPARRRRPPTPPDEPAADPEPRGDGDPGEVPESATAPPPNELPAPSPRRHQPPTGPRHDHRRRRADREPRTDDDELLRPDPMPDRRVEHADGDEQQPDGSIESRRHTGRVRHTHHDAAEEAQGEEPFESGPPRPSAPRSQPVAGRADHHGGRPQAPAVANAADEQPDAEGPGAEPDRDEPPSLADELRRDRARRPRHGAGGTGESA